MLVGHYRSIEVRLKADEVVTNSSHTHTWVKRSTEERLNPCLQTAVKSAECLCCVVVVGHWVKEKEVPFCYCTW